jgi:hypothetical protein
MVLRINKNQTVKYYCENIASASFYTSQSSLFLSVICLIDKVQDNYKITHMEGALIDFSFQADKVTS